MPNRKSITENFMAGVANQRKSQHDVTTKVQAEKALAETQYQEEKERKERALRRTFPVYYKDVAPLLDILEKLPPRNGEEFFIRADLNAGYKVGNIPMPKNINIWILYTSDNAATAGAPSGQGQGHGITTHSLTINKKGDKSSQPETARLALNDRPVLHLQLSQEDGCTEISSHSYHESYNHAPRQRSPGLYRGEWRRNMEEYNHETHKSLRDFVRVIGAWVSEAAPERLDDIHKALTPVSTALAAPVQTLKPLKIRLNKPQPPGA